MLDAVQGRDTSVRGTISKGRFVQGAQHPRIFGQGHTGRGHINPASPSSAAVALFLKDNAQRDGERYFAPSPHFFPIELI
jgi:hypothetical protein